jgi:hypothetical protein
MAGWFMHVLGAGVPIRIAPAAGPDYAGLAHVELIAPGFDAVIEVVEDGNVRTAINGEALQLTKFPETGEYEALRAELTVVGRDRVFEDALGLANLMYKR